MERFFESDWFLDFPLLISKKIVDYCDIETLYEIKSVNFAYYGLVDPIIKRKEMVKMKQEIKKFIRACFDKYDIERAEDLQRTNFSVVNGSNYDEKIEQLRKLNDEVVDNIENHDKIICLYQLAKWIKYDNVRNMDKEFMIDFITNGFIFGLAGELIIFNER